MTSASSWHPFPRSEINRLIEDSLRILSLQGFSLPPFAFWTPEDWAKASEEWDGLRKARLGWDVTDFGWGRFSEYGRVIFTLRNGIRTDGSLNKPYAEKVIIGRHGQRSPAHSHIHKVEDIINRGGGNLILKVRPAQENGSSRVFQDGREFLIQSATLFRLKAGESLCIPPGVIHEFWGEETEAGKVTLIGEVSSFCDDVADNVFLKPVARFANILEDEKPRFCLCHELPDFVKAGESELQAA